MKWILQKETGATRVYRNESTGTECRTDLIHTDRNGNKWFGFYDLFNIPYIRTAQAKNISDLFTMGLTPGDITKWITEEKALLKAAINKSDPEAYEKLYALVLQKEQIIKTVVDPLKQHLTLCTIYVLTEDERIDYYTPDIGAAKLEAWALDTEAQSFFLNWHAGHIQNFMKDYKNITQIALKAKEMVKSNMKDLQRE